MGTAHPVLCFKGPVELFQTLAHTGPKGEGACSSLLLSCEARENRWHPGGDSSKSRGKQESAETKGKDD